MFTVTGYLAGVAYRAIISGTPDELTGVVQGPTALKWLLLSRSGRPLELTPTGPTITLDLADPQAVLAALRTLTEVVDVAGDNIPASLVPSEPGVVY